MSKKLGFALGSGGSRGIAHIGFLEAMEEEGITPDYIAGSSMGSVVGACYASGMTITAMKEAVASFKKNEILDFDGNLLKAQSLFRSKKLHAKLENFLGDKTFEDLKIPFACVAVDLITGEAVTFKEKHKVVDCVQASSTIPGIFRPVEIDEYLLVDGGLKNRLPIETCRKLGAEVVIAIDVLGKVKPSTKVYNVMTVLFRTIDIMDYSVTEHKLKKHKPDLLLEPEMGDISQYKFNNFDKAYAAGYKLGKENADLIKELIK